MSESEIKYSIIDSSKCEEVAELLLASFFVEEPLGVALGLTTLQVTRWLPAHMNVSISHGVSYMATVKEDGIEKIVGVSINVIKTPEDECPSILSYLDKELEPNMWQVARFLSMLNEDLDIATTILGGNTPEKTMSCLFLNVDKDYAGRGIGKALSMKSEELARDIGVSLLQVDTTSEYSYKVYTNLGYTTIRSIPFDEFRDEDGVKIINEEDMGVHQYGRVLVKVLKR